MEIKRKGEGKMILTEQQRKILLTPFNQRNKESLRVILYKSVLHIFNAFEGHYVSMPVDAYSLRNDYNESIDLPIAIDPDKFLPFLKYKGDFRFTFNLKTRELIISNNIVDCVLSLDCVLPEEWDIVKSFHENYNIDAGIYYYFTKENIKDLHKFSTFLAIGGNRECLQYFYLDKKNLVATDGHRFCEIKEEFMTNLVKDESLLIPYWAFKLFKIRSGCKAQHYTTDGFVGLIIHCEGIQVRVRITQGLKYPAYKNILPSKYSFSKRFVKQELIERLEQIPTNERTHLVTFDFRLLKLIGKNKFDPNMVDMGRVFPKSTSGLDRIGFNSKYLLQILKLVRSDSVTFNFTTHIGPCIIKDDNRLYLIMPLRILD